MQRTAVHTWTGFLTQRHQAGQHCIRNHQLQPYIIDFGKAHRIDCGKMYTLSESERQEFKVEHSHITLDLRDGLVA